MEELLERIAGKELPGYVELPGHGGGPVFKQIENQLEREIERVEDETRAVLSDNWPLFSQQFETGKRLLDSLNQEEELLDHIEQRINGPLIPTLRSRLEQHAKLAASHAFATASVELLSTLSVLHDQVSTLSTLVSDGALASAVDQVPNVVRSRTNVADWIRETSQFETLDQWATDELTRLEESLVRAFESCFVWQGQQPGHGTLTIQARVTTVDHAQAEQMHVRTILECLQTLWAPSGRQNRVAQLLAALCNKLLQHILLPVIRGHASITYHPAPPTAIVSLEPSKDVIGNVTSFLAFLASQTSLLASPHARAITVVLTPAIQEALVSSFLTASLPIECADLPSLFETVESALKFETFLNEKGWFAHIPVDHTQVEERRLVRDWSDRIGHHWAKNVGVELLDALRDAVKRFKWEAKPVDVSVLVPREPTPPPPPTPPPAAIVPLQPAPTNHHAQDDAETTENSFDDHEGAQIAKPKRGKQKLGTKVLSKATPVLDHHQHQTTNGHAAAAPNEASSNRHRAVSNDSQRSSGAAAAAAAAAPSVAAAEVEEDAWGFDIDDDLAVEEAGAPIAMSNDTSASSNTPSHPPPPRIPPSASVSTLKGAPAVTHSPAALALEEASLDEDGWGFGDEEAAAGEGQDEDEESLIGVDKPMSPVMIPKSSPSLSAAAAFSATVDNEQQPGSNGTRLYEDHHDHNNEQDMEAREQDEDFDEEAGWGWNDEPLSIGSSPVLERHSPRLPPAAEPMTVPPQSQAQSSASASANKSQARKEKQDEYRTETMLVSDLSRTVVESCERVLNEMVQVSAMSLPPSFGSAAPMLRQTFTSILSLYRALVPVQHSKALSTVPAIGMQFSNDLNWIADEVKAVRLRFGGDEQLDASLPLASVDDAVVTMKALSKEWRLRTIKTQRDDLMDSLDEADHFLNTDNDVRYAACERAVQQVIHTLHQTMQQWKPVLTASTLYSTMGELVNDVLQRVLDDIESQFDIAEEESVKLNKLCTMLHELESLFEGTETSIGREVPVWFKFVFLSELLEASMADIIFLFDHGHLVDFSIDEIAKLVRALFSDSPLRQKNLEHIMRGHPDPSTLEYED